MTVPLSLVSPRRAAAQAFGVELQRIMQRRRLGTRAVATLASTSRGSVVAWLSGHNLPRFGTAVRLAEALDAPTLAALIESARHGTCEICGRDWINESGGPRRYCSIDCQSVANGRRSGRPARARAVVAERRLARSMAAIKLFCRECEPDGLCRTPTCRLRPVSPLPAAALRRA